jgi:excisionase family DNA binding protein
MTILATSSDTPSIDAPSLVKRDAASYFNVSQRTIDRLRASGALGYARVGGQVRFAWSDLLAFKMKNEVAAR